MPSAPAGTLVQFALSGVRRAPGVRASWAAAALALWLAAISYSLYLNCTRRPITGSAASYWGEPLLEHHLSRAWCMARLRLLSYDLHYVIERPFCALTRGCYLRRRAAATNPARRSRPWLGGSCLPDGIAAVSHYQMADIEQARCRKGFIDRVVVALCLPCDVATTQARRRQFSTGRGQMKRFAIVCYALSVFRSGAKHAGRATVRIPQAGFTDKPVHIAKTSCRSATANSIRPIAINMDWRQRQLQIVRQPRCRDVQLK